MNLGQAFGIDRLRIMQLEDELERQGKRVPPARETPTLPIPQFLHRDEEAPRPPIGRAAMHRGVFERVHSALPSRAPGLLLREISAICGVPGKTCSSYLSQSPDVGRTGVRRSYRYFKRTGA